jgi:hypothetical protein
MKGGRAKGERREWEHRRMKKEGRKRNRIRGYEEEEQKRKKQQKNFRKRRMKPTSIYS